MEQDSFDIQFLQDALVEAGRLALGQRGQMIATVKADLTPVTEVDRQVENFLAERIRARYPGHRILSEEGGLIESGEAVTWVIDPIDGTRAFASGLPVWGVSIGVLQDGQPQAGGLYLPVTGEMYWGTRRQAYYNDRALPPLPAVDLESPLVFLAVPSDFHLSFQIRYPRVRSLGSTAAHLAYVATGAAVGALVQHHSLWDIAGILPLLAAVGVRAVTLSGADFRPAEMADGRKAKEPFLAAHPSAIEPLLETIEPLPA